MKEKGGISEEGQHARLVDLVWEKRGIEKKEYSMSRSKCIVLAVALLIGQTAVLSGLSLAAGTETNVVEQWFKDSGLGWLKGLHFKADFRLRYQGEWWEYTDSDDREQDNDRHRGRIRVRFGFTKRYKDDGLTVGFRLASGSSDDPTSTNQTLEGNFSKKPVWIDLAYVEYSPPVLPGLTLAGGKVKNPFVHTDIIWDSDVNMDGLYQSFELENGAFRPFITLGEMFLDENKMDTDHDSGVLAGQVGMKLKVALFSVNLAATYYDFDEFERNYRGSHGNAVGDDGVLAAGDFDVFDVVAQLGTKVADIPIKVVVDYAVNTAEDARGESEFEGKDTAMAAHLKVGKCKKKHDWEVNYKYAYIEANAVPGDFCDSDFGHANRKGHKLSVGYQPFKKASLHLTGFWTQPNNLLKGQESHDHYTIQADLKVKF